VSSQQRSGFQNLVSLFFLFFCCSSLSHPSLPHPSGSLSNSQQSAGQRESTSSFLQVGEELRYKVSYLFIGLGEVVLRVTDRFEREGQVQFRAEALIDSYSGTPFVNLHHYYICEFDTTLVSHYFYARWLSSDTLRYVIYRFDYEAKKVYVESGTENPRVQEKADTVDIDRPYQDGLSLFYFARGNVTSTASAVVPTFINEKKGKTLFNFTNEKTKEEIDSVPYPIQVVEFEGEANWVGIFGLTGGFKGWFSDDYARIPIAAKMKVIIGSVKLKLISWKRAEWRPPEYIKDE
jgi:hypothetical protein